MTTLPTIIILALGLADRTSPAERGASRGASGPGRGRVAAAHALSTALRNALATHLPVVVVTDADLAPLAHQQVAARDVVVIPAALRGHGIGDAIAAGVAARADAPGWLVLPADRPHIASSTLQRVAAALDTHAVAYAQYRGLRGHPVGFSAELYSELIVLSGDEGARRLVARYPAQAVAVDDPAVLTTGDSEIDAATLRGAHGGSTDAMAPRYESW